MEKKTPKRRILILTNFTRCIGYIGYIGYIFGRYLVKIYHHTQSFFSWPFEIFKTSNLNLARKNKYCKNGKYEIIWPPYETVHCAARVAGGSTDYTDTKIIPIYLFTV